MKRRSAKVVIEREVRKKPEYEHSFLKKSGKNPRLTTLESSEMEVVSDERKEQILYKKGYDTDIHNHPTNSYTRFAAGTPSGSDFRSFLNKPEHRTMVVAQTDDSNGEVQGYIILRKPKNQEKLKKCSKEYEEDEKLFKEDRKKWFDKHPKRINESQEITKDSPLRLDIYKYTSMRDYHKSSGGEVLEELKRFCNKYQIRYRFKPMPGYEFNNERGLFEKRKGTTLESRVATAVFIMIISVLIISYIKTTGFAINTLNNTSTVNNIFFTLLFIFIFSILFGITIKLTNYLRNSKSKNSKNIHL